MAWPLTVQRTGAKVNVKLSTNAIDPVMRFGVSKRKSAGQRSRNFHLFRSVLIEVDKLPLA